MADPRIPEEFQDAVNNPSVFDPDPYAVFDPTDPAARTAMIVAQAQWRPGLTDKKPTKREERESYLSPEYAAREATRLASAYAATRGVASPLTVEDYVTPKERQGVRIRDVANFLFGDEMGAIGVKLDQEHASWSLENAIQQWSEHPLRTPISLLSWTLPGIGKVIKSRRMAKYANIQPEELVDSLKLSSVDDWHKMAPEYQDKLRSLHYHDTKFADLINMDKNTPEAMSLMDKFQLGFYRSFAHRYSTLSDPSSSAVHDLTFKTNLDAKIQDEIVAPFVVGAPADKHGAMIARYWTGDVPLERLPPEVRDWAQGMGSMLETLQDEMLTTGFITRETFEKVGKRYVPLLPKSQPLAIGGPTQSITLLERGRPVVREIGRLESPALLERTTGLDEFIDMMKAEEVITNPKIMTVRGLMEGTLLHENYKHIVDMAMDARHGIDGAGFAKMVEKIGLKRAKEDWIPLFGDSTRPGIPGAERFARMIAKAKGVSSEELGAHYLSKQAFEQVFGPNGVIGQSREAVKAFENLVRIYKTSKTAFNVYTHLQNFSGNMVFLSMRGFRLFSGPEAGENWKLIRNSVTNMNEHLSKQRVAMKTGAEAKVNLKSMKVGDRVFSPEEVAAELKNPWVKEIIEESAFLQAEGSNLGFLSKIAEKSENVSEFLAKGVRKTEDFLSTWKRFYNVEDSAPKLAYYFKLRAKGFTAHSASQEVARALPVYRGIAEGPRVPGLGRVGPASLRKMMFPWISFPAETMRIMKNNIIDNPMRVLPWLKSVNIMQAMMYGSSQMGVGEPFTYEDHLGIRRQLPIHAQRPTAVTTPFTDKNNDIRSIMMDFLPFSTVLPNTLASEAPTLSKIPVVSPEDIAPIFTGILGLMTGRGPMGQEIRWTDKSDLVGKLIANAVGFLAPPYVQKYMFDIMSPREQSVTGLNTYKFEQDLGKVVNPQTLKSGSWLADHLLNNVVMKNYPSSAEQELYNKQLKVTRTIDRVRGELTRRWNAAIRSNRAEEASPILQQIMETFVKEYGPGPTAQKKSVEWLIRHRRSIMKHPQLKRFSEEDLIRMLIENNGIAVHQRTTALKRTNEALRQEIMIRRRGR